MEKTNPNKFLISVIVLLISVLFFLGGVAAGLRKQNYESFSINSEQIMLKIPKTRAELEKQYLLNRAQFQILEQMLKWDMYKEEKK